jgi:hypothetical protein
MHITEVIHHLKTLSEESDITLRPPASDEAIAGAERVYNVRLPDDFWEFYRFSDGFEKDEDVFSLLTLEEVIANKLQHKRAPICFAEHMGYCDTWHLEINPEDCNDYKILVEWNYNDILLTNSLAEFIMRVVKGDVYGEDGLYNWCQELAPLSVYPTQIKAVGPLLTVFYHGLVQGFVSKKEIVDWAAQLVAYENEPVSFFVELAQCSDENKLAGLLHAVYAPKNPVSVRATLGLLHHSLQAGTITVGSAVAAMCKAGFYNPLTAMERVIILELTTKALTDKNITNDEEFAQALGNFLSCYKAFEIAHYKDWGAISENVKYKVTRNG